MNHKQIAENILKGLGGKENISAISHCATRLRIVLNDDEKIDEAALTDIDEVKGTFATGGQFQIILGSGIVNTVYGELSQLTGLKEMSTADVKKEATKKLNPLQQLVKLLSDVFVPIIPAIVAGGLLMGINNLLTAQDLFIDGMSIIEANPGIADLANFIYIIANAPFVYLPVLIGFSAAKRFGGNGFLGAALGMVMVHPSLLNAWGMGAAEYIPTWNIMGLEISRIGYQGTVLPILASAFILANIERFLRKRVHTSIDNLVTPLVTLFVTAILTFTVVGPMMRMAGDGLTMGITWLHNTAGFIGGGLFGLVYAPVVITGMHHSFSAVEVQLLADIATTGGTFIFVVAAMSNVAQGAAALAVFFTTKETKLKGIASASGISALLGITEPAMFGVNLKLKYPFIAAITGAAVASAFVTLFGVKAVALGAAGLPGVISIRPDDLAMYVAGMAISFLIAFVGTFIMAKRQKPESEVA